ncbi:MAG: hypothetical protein EOO89_25830 [Pedobacter sp.]|nr:MAG: hypothetical protein EOO89_25830 [Pedobacter sp.]
MTGFLPFSSFERSILLMLIACLFCLEINAQTPVKKHAEGFAYEELVTGNTNNKDLPLLIAFHYSAGTPAESFKDYDALGLPVRIIVVKGSYVKRTGFSYFPVNYYSFDNATQVKLAKQTVDSLASFIKHITQLYKVKPVVSGISQGGDISFLLGIHYPELLRASFPFAAVIRPEAAEFVSSAARNTLPIFAYQGEADKIVNVNDTREQVNKLKAYLNIQLTTYEGLGHDISPEMKKDYSLLMRKLLSK